MASQQPCFLCARYFRAAVALSNTGVTLLERHSYRDAVATIRDALFLIRAASPPPGDSDMLQPRNESDIQLLVRRAAYCLARSRPADAHLQGTAFKLKVFSDTQGSPSDVTRYIGEADLFAVRIDDSRYDGSAYPTYSDASTMLLNYGTACRCLQFFCHKHDPSLLYEAYDFLHMSYGVVVRQLLPTVKRIEEIEVCRLMVIAVLVLQNLMQLCIQLELPMDHFQNYGHKFDRICDTFSRLTTMPHWGYTHTAPAA